VTFVEIADRDQLGLADNHFGRARQHVLPRDLRRKEGVVMEVGSVTRKWKIGLVAFGLIGAIGHFTSKKPSYTPSSEPGRMILAEPTASTKPLRRVATFSLVRDFQDDWYSAQKRYSDAVVEINGVVIRKEASSDGAYVYFKGTSSLGLKSVRIATQASALQRVAIGSPASFRCSGGVDSYGGLDLQAKSCSLIQAEVK
jgi:hypothetical protein